MANRTRTPNMIKMLETTDKCELCGSSRNLEVHHIIPVVCGGPENDENNMIVVCSACHQRLTPRGLLSKMGIEKVLNNEIVWRIYKNFYYRMNEEYERFGLEALDEYDVFDEVIDHELILCSLRNGEITKDDLKKYDISILHNTKIVKQTNQTNEKDLLKPKQLSMFEEETA